MCQLFDRGLLPVLLIIPLDLLDDEMIDPLSIGLIISFIAHGLQYKRHEDLAANHITKSKNRAKRIKLLRKI